MVQKRKFKKNSRKVLQNREDYVTRLMVNVALLLLVLCPLAFRMIRLDFISPSITNAGSLDTGIVYDSFSYIKMVILYAATAILLCCFLYKLFATPYDFRFTKYDCLILLLCALLFVSFFFSEQKSIALTGFIYMFDGTLTHICFCLLFLFGFRVLSGERFYERFALPVVIVCSVNAVISLLNFFEVKIIDTAIVKAILAVPEGTHPTDAMAFTSTFGNINYLSGFGGICFAFFLTKLIMNRNKREFLSALLLVAASFSIVVTSFSSSGFFTCVIIAPIVLVITLSQGMSKQKLAATGAGLTACVLLFLSLSAMNPLVLEETFGMFGNLKENVLPEVVQKSVETASNYPSDSREYAADTSAPIATYVIERARQVQITARHTSTGLLGSKDSPERVPDAVTPLPIVTAVVSSSPALELPVFPEPAVAPGTGRLYIWKETIKLIIQRPLSGYGMDTITFNFPQRDIAKISGLGSHQIIVTKPHNAYLGYAYGAGIPALLVFLLLNLLAGGRFLIYIIHCRRNKKTISVAVLCYAMAWSAYLVQACVNDDLIATAPIWWTLLGIGLGVIHREMTSR